MKGWQAKALLFTLTGALALAAGFFAHRGSRNVVPPPSAAGSDTLQHTALPDLDGSARRVADWEGKVRVVNFWATWCGPCREEIPALIRIQSRYGARGVQVIGIALDDLDRVRPFAAEMGINYPTLMAGIDGLDLATAAGNKVGALPFTVYIDRQGKVVHAELGGVDDGKLTSHIESLL